MRRIHAISLGTCGKADRRMRQGAHNLVELNVAMTIGCIIFLIGTTALWVGWRGQRDIMRAGTVYQNAFWAMNDIQENIERCHTITIPDPNQPAPSIQLSVPQQLANGTGPSGTYSTYEYWLNGTKLMMNNGNGAKTIFTNVTAFSAVMQDAPTNSLVLLTLTCNAAGTGTETITVSTIAQRRN